MNSGRVSQVVLFVLLLCGVNSEARDPSTFAVYDATLYQGKPNLVTYGLKPITIIYAASMWKRPDDVSGDPDPDIIRSQSIHAMEASGMAVIDIEHWPVTGSSFQVQDSVKKYSQTIEEFKKASPGLKVGCYGIVPIWNYWNVARHADDKKLQAWRSQDDRLSKVSQLVDAFFPSLYTYDSNQTAWKTYAIDQISEAHRLAPGKPVYVFLWPQYHGEPNSYLPPDFWRMELETARRYADGIVIWGGYKQNWDPKAPWWTQTQEFLKEQ